MNDAPPLQSSRPPALVNPMRRALVLGGALVGVSALSVAAKPRPMITAEGQVPDLDAITPKAFGAWRIDPHTVPLQVSPQVEAMLSTIYDRTLSRTYVNEAGNRVMLSLAYGGNQSRALQLHKPEVCYAAQGFRISGLFKSDWRIAGARVPTMHMVGTLGTRVEPVTYWMRIGDDIARGWFEQNAARLKYGLSGLIPDGLLYRVSVIGADASAAYRLQEEFSDALLGALAWPQRELFVGAEALASAA